MAQIPRAEKGKICPLFKKDVSYVCHKCTLWEKIRVRTVEIPQQEYDHWDCALKLAVIINRDVGIGMVGVQAAIESMRNEQVRMINEQTAEMRRANDLNLRVYARGLLNVDGPHGPLMIDGETK